MVYTSNPSTWDAGEYLQVEGSLNLLSKTLPQKYQNKSSENILSLI